jgi:hypothetical protein
MLLYGSETWTIKARDARRITAAEMKYMRRTAGYTWTDYKTNAQIAKELKITPVLDKLLEYKRNWIQHVNRMSYNRLPRVMKHYSQLAEGIMADLRRDFWIFWIRETGTGQQVAQLHDRYMMMMNNCLQDVLELTPTIDLITLFCILNIFIYNSPPIPPPRIIFQTIGVPEI